MKEKASEGELWVDVDQSTQTLSVMKGRQRLATIIVSTGVDEHPTPNGVFTIGERGEWFFNSQYGQGAKYWVAFDDRNQYLFHSTTCDENQEIIPAEAALLGTKASHGCIRMSLEEARWFYDTIPAGTRVVIHD